MRARRLPTAIAAGALLGGAFIAFPVSANAAVFVPLTYAELAAAISTPDGPHVVHLDADIADTAGVLSVAPDAEITLDLGSSELRVMAVALGSGSTLTITGTETGSLIADASPSWGTPGILTTGATLIVRSGRVTATGGNSAASIGGADDSDAGPFGDGPASADGGRVEITGGTVIANTPAGDHGAGIGGGRNGSGGTTIITGGSVTASGAYQGAGIGGSVGYPARHGGTTTIGGDAVVSATGGANASGIGGGQSGDGGSTSISGSAHVTAVGGESGAGIGGSGTVTISGSPTVLATGGASAAGIGGQSGSPFGAIVIDGGIVTAAGGDGSLDLDPMGNMSRDGGAGIGAGDAGSTGDVTISGGTVTAINGLYGPTAIGPFASTAHLAVSDGANLVIPSGSTLNAPSPGTVVVDDGVISGDGLLTGASGGIQNLGAVTVPTANVTPADTLISDRNFLVNFPAEPGSPSVRVFAETMTAGARSLPAPPSGSGRVSWNTEIDGSGDEFTADSTLWSAAIGVYAADRPWQTAVTAHPAGIPVAGRAMSVPVTVSATEPGSPTPVGSVRLLVDGAPTGSGIPLVDGAATLTWPQPVEGARSVVVSFTPTDDEVLAPVSSAPAVVTVLSIADAADSLDLVLDAASVDQGDTVSFTVTAEDVAGVSLGDVSAAVTLTSDVSSDVIAGNRVSFPHASPHVITATLGSATTSLLVEVIPAPATIPAAAEAPTALAQTGIPDAAPFAVLAGIAAIIAGLAILRRRGLARPQA